MSALLELAERCEAATGPDRQLDAELCVAAAPICLADYVLSATPSSNRVGMVTRHFDEGGHGTFVADRYTASVDAALTLVPEGWRIDGMRDHIIPKPYTAVGIVCWSDRAHGKAVTRALAICAAALRARAV